jgi:hypothetical protein
MDDLGVAEKNTQEVDNSQPKDASQDEGSDFSDTEDCSSESHKDIFGGKHKNRKKSKTVCECGRKCKGKLGLAAHKRHCTYMSVKRVVLRPLTPESVEPPIANNASESEGGYEITEFDETEFDGKRNKFQKKKEKIMTSSNTNYLLPGGIVPNPATVLASLPLVNGAASTNLQQKTNGANASQVSKSFDVFDEPNAANSSEAQAQSQVLNVRDGISATCYTISEVQSVTKHGVGDLLGKITQIFSSYENREKLAFVVKKRGNDLIFFDSVESESQRLVEKNAALKDLIDDISDVQNLLCATLENLDEMREAMQEHGEKLSKVIGDLATEQKRKKKRRLN